MKNPIYKKTTATLAEVALKAGVSRQTAGRILGDGAHKHKQATVEKVQQAADQLGYRPNLLAKSVVAGRTYSIGVLMPQVNNDDFFAQVITGIQDALADTATIPLFLQTSEKAPEIQQIHRLVDRRVDGIILIPHVAKVEEDYFSEIIDRNIPVVCVNARLHNIEAVDFVGTNEYDGGKKGAEYLLSKGHKTFCSVRHAFFSDNMSMRQEGFFQTLENVGAACDMLNLPGWTLEENLQPIIEYLDRSDRPTAFFCASDIYAAQLYKAADTLGLTIPDDLSVLGFADLFIAQYLSPPLTSLKQNGTDIGYAAVHMLTARIEGHRGPAQEKRLPVSLIERESVQAL